MGLLSIFKSKDQDTIQHAASGSASELADAVQQARARARHRLIGAAVLVLIGVIVFPLLFETQPRPVAVDIPIEIPRKESAPPLVMPERKPATSRVPISETMGSEAVAEVVDEPIRDATVNRAEAVTPTASASPGLAATGNVRTAPPSPAWVPPGVPTSHAESSPRIEAAEDKAQRFIVQAGAFSENSAAREVRVKVEKLGLKTFVQVAETADGKRIRVRVGPFGSRDEAEKVLARVKAAGISAAVLTL